jgi:hypothetical protein
LDLQEEEWENNQDWLPTIFLAFLFLHVPLSFGIEILTFLYDTVLSLSPTSNAPRTCNCQNTYFSDFFFLLPHMRTYSNCQVFNDINLDLIFSQFPQVYLYLSFISVIHSDWLTPILNQWLSILVIFLLHFIFH